ncbi:hypothetical protein GDO81_008475 [Engystomops pustulosus]|uniref:Uncharacterized protein n=1 Tax=Engystomops pustulosus TaxID=76066 RepID=A0AAV7CF24_ENGPU|nr:hypothetical protein GDO81_008475 [Engystomops pustulosus]
MMSKSLKSHKDQHSILKRGTGRIMHWPSMLHNACLTVFQGNVNMYTRYNSVQIQQSLIILGHSCKCNILHQLYVNNFMFS